MGSQRLFPLGEFSLLAEVGTPNLTNVVTLAHKGLPVERLPLSTVEALKGWITAVLEGVPRLTIKEIIVTNEALLVEFDRGWRVVPRGLLGPLKDLTQEECEEFEFLNGGKAVSWIHKQFPMTAEELWGWSRPLLNKEFRATCDNPDGPCSCGAWHRKEEALQEEHKSPEGGTEGQPRRVRGISYNLKERQLFVLFTPYEWRALPMGRLPRSLREADRLVLTDYRVIGTGQGIHWNEVGEGLSADWLWGWSRPLPEDQVKPKLPEDKEVLGWIFRDPASLGYLPYFGLLGWVEERDLEDLFPTKESALTSRADWAKRGFWPKGTKLVKVVRKKRK